MKRSVLLTLAALTFLARTEGQDLPNPAANLQTLPAGSVVIAMDNTYQADGSNKFNLKAYGLVVHLLNYGAKIKWAIKAGKVKDGIDFSANSASIVPVANTVTSKITTTNGSIFATVNNASGLTAGMTVTSSSNGLQAGTTITAISGLNITLSLPATANISNKNADFTSYTYPASSRSFKSGPFVIFAADTLGVRSLINSFYTSQGLTGSNRPNVFFTTTSTANVDIRYNLTGFVPKAAIMTDGGNSDIHRDFMIAAGITSQNYKEVAAFDLSECYTFASEPHNDESGAAVNATVAAIKNFVNAGRNFLAECAAVRNYENNVNGHFHTNDGISDANANIGTNVNYNAADLAYYQFDGTYNGSAGGSLKNWNLNGSPKYPSAYVNATGVAGNSAVQAATYTKTVSGVGGLVFYLGNHNFSTNSQQGINGIRMYMNAFLMPSSLAGSDCDFPLLGLQLFNFNGNLNMNKVNLSWNVAHNENAQQFEVEESTNGSQFNTAGLVLSSNNSGEEKYGFGVSMKAAKMYFRLKITEKNGATSYSKILAFQSAVETVSNNTLKVLNNPASDKLTLSFQSSASQAVTIQLIDMTGRRIMQQQVNSYTGNNITSLTLPSALNNGIYIVDLFDGVSHSTSRFVKQ